MKVVVEIVKNSEAGPMMVHDRTTVSGGKVWYPPQPEVLIGRVVEVRR
jgi:hypothetical protein